MLDLQHSSSFGSMANAGFVAGLNEGVSLPSEEDPLKTKLVEISSLF